MKFILSAFLVACVAGLGVEAAAPSKYTTRYDNINIDDILKNERLYKQYYECLIGKGKCTAEGKELKTILPDALATGCSKCSEKQKVGTEKVVRHLLEHRKQDYLTLEKIFDPSGVYRKKYEAEAKKRGIKV
uniref:Chemosensory protein n=1 Tax=Corythucha ciliata TaxID=369451 RepID=A0A2S0M1F1_CORCT|nr:chemosensory protein [Corythucha ciliata]